MVSATRRRALVATLSIIAAVLVIGAAILWGRRRPPTNGDSESNFYQAIEWVILFIEQRVHLISSINKSLSCRP